VVYLKKMEEITQLFQQKAINHGHSGFAAAWVGGYYLEVEKRESAVAEPRDFPAWLRVGSSGCWVVGIPTSASGASQQQLRESSESYPSICFFSRCIYSLRQSYVHTGNHLLLTV